MKLVLQCAMCGTHHPVGTIVCTTCRATGVAQLRLMFECQTCGRLDLKPTCESCPLPAVAPPPDPFTLDLDDELIVAEEVIDDAPLELGEGEEDEKLVVDVSDEPDDDEFDDESESEFEELDLDLDDVFDEESETEFDEEPDDEDEQEEDEEDY